MCFLAAEGIDVSKGHENNVVRGRSGFYIKSYSFASRMVQRNYCAFSFLFFLVFVIVPLIKHMRMTENNSVKDWCVFQARFEILFLIWVSYDILIYSRKRSAHLFLEMNPKFLGTVYTKCCDVFGPVQFNSYIYII